MNEYGDTMQEVAPHSFAIRVLGPYMLGQCFNLVLYGLSLSFFLHYRQTLAYRNDSAWLRRLILLVVGLNSYQAVINLLQILFWGTTQDRSTVDLWGLTPVDCMAPMGLGVIGVIVQGWLAKRAVGLIRGRLGRHLLTAVFVLGMLAFSIGSVLFSIMSWLYYSGAQVQNLPLTYNKSLAFMLISGAFTDCLISASLFYALGKRYTGFATATDGVVHKVIRTGLETAAYTAVAAVIGAVLCLIFGDNSPYAATCMVFVYPLASLYTTSLFTTIALRQNLRLDLAASHGVNSLSTRPGDPDARRARSAPDVLGGRQRAVTGPDRMMLERGSQGNGGRKDSPRLPLSWELDIEKATSTVRSVDVVLTRSSRGALAPGSRIPPTTGVGTDSSHSSAASEEKEVVVVV